MTAIISFIGWHESGKTTLAAGVVAHLHRKGLRVAVIKSSEKRGISFDTPDTDTSVHRRAGAAEVMLVAPDQMALLAAAKDLSLTTLAHRYFADAGIVIGEGFKEARQIAKIEVVTDPAQPLLVPLPQWSAWPPHRRAASSLPDLSSHLHPHLSRQHRQ